MVKIQLDMYNLFMKTFQETLFDLQRFWSQQGCVILQAYDLEKGAGTMSPHTFLRVLGKKPWYAAYVEPCRRPSDGRYCENPNRLQHYFQFQVVMKPSPKNIQALYIRSLEAIGLLATEHDIRFVEDNWESPTLGATGVGWEVWLDGMEISQFTYFQQCGGVQCSPVTVELTYGLERLAMYQQKVDSVMAIIWHYDLSGKSLTYGDIYYESELEHCRYNFEYADIEILFQQFMMAEKEAKSLLDKSCLAPAYDYCLKCSHLFNVLDARGAISVTERMAYILRIRALAKRCASSYLEQDA